MGRTSGVAPPPPTSNAHFERPDGFQINCDSATSRVPVCPSSRGRLRPFYCERVDFLVAAVAAVRRDMSTVHRVPLILVADSSL